MISWHALCGNNIGPWATLFTWALVFLCLILFVFCLVFYFLLKKISFIRRSRHYTITREGLKPLSRAGSLSYYTCFNKGLGICSLIWKAAPCVTITCNEINGVMDSSEIFDNTWLHICSCTVFTFYIAIRYC